VSNYNYAALVLTSCHPGGSTGAVPVLTSFQINTFVAVPKLFVNPNPVGLTVAVPVTSVTLFKVAVNGNPVTSTWVTASALTFPVVIAIDRLLATFVTGAFASPLILKVLPAAKLLP